MTELIEEKIISKYKRINLLRKTTIKVDIFGALFVRIKNLFEGKGCLTIVDIHSVRTV